MEKDQLIRMEDLVDNPSPRVPICLCLDTSGSMTGQPIEELQQGVNSFFEAIKNDDVAKYGAEICVVTFDDTVKILADYATVDIQPNPPQLTSRGLTFMGEGVNLALDLLDERKEDYKRAGVDYFQPWLILMTDGAPNGDAEELANAIERTRALVNDRKLTVFPIGIGASADMKVLEQFSPTRPALRLKGLNFPEFFEWLSQSVSMVSNSMVGDKIKLDIEGLKGWAEI